MTPAAIVPTDPEVLRRGPRDFDGFWRRAHEEASLVSPGARRVREVAVEASHRLTEVRFTTTDGLEIGGLLREPLGGMPRRGVVRLCGYGGLQSPPPAIGLRDAVEFFPVPRGLPDLSLLESIPSEGMEHVLHGIADRESYVLRGCVQDVWVAVSALCELVPELERFDLTGESFGGGVGALALPWESRFTAGVLTVPTFGDHPARLQTPCAGSGEAVRLHRLMHPEVDQVLPYFDAATAAARVRTPVLVVIGRADPAVPPVGQRTIYDLLGGQRMLLEQTAGHLDHPGLPLESRTIAAATAAWLA